MRVDDDELGGEWAIGRDVQLAAVRADAHALRSGAGGGRDADGVFLAGLGVEDRDVGAVDRSPAGVDVPAVRADRQIGHAVGHRVRRDDSVGVMSNANIES